MKTVIEKQQVATWSEKDVEIYVSDDGKCKSDNILKVEQYEKNVKEKEERDARFNSIKRIDEEGRFSKYLDTYFYIEKYGDLIFLIKDIYGVQNVNSTGFVSGRENFKKLEDVKYTGWIKIKFEDGGDYSDYVQVSYEYDIKDYVSSEIERLNNLKDLMKEIWEE